jgi:hypothetical protein
MLLNIETKDTNNDHAGFVKSIEIFPVQFMTQRPSSFTHNLLFIKSGTVI